MKDADGYDAEDNAAKCYDVAITAMREKHGRQRDYQAIANMRSLKKPKTGSLFDLDAAE